MSVWLLGSNSILGTFMIGFRAALVAVLSCGLLAGECQYDSPPVTIVEYRQKSVATEKIAPDSQVFVLWRWTPVAPVAIQPTTRPARQFPVEVEQVYASRGSPVGFRRSNGELLAVAGATTKTLDEAYYTWRTLLGCSDKIRNRQRRADNFVTAIEVAVAVVVVVVLVALVVQRKPAYAVG